MTTWPIHPIGCYKIGFVRQYGTECTVEKFFCPSGRFKSKDLTTDGELIPKSRTDVYAELTYRTHYGWSFAHNGIIYRESGNNLRLAMRRLLSTRIPDGCSDRSEAIKYESKLRFSQQLYIKLFREEIIKIIQSQLTLPIYYDRIEQAIESAIRPHPKRKLRAQALNDIHDHGEIAMSWSKSVWWKLKLDEYAKPGKYPRVIVDLGVASSLEGALWIEKCKKQLADQWYKKDNWYYMFCSQPEPTIIIELMKVIWWNNYGASGYLLVFSDDAILGTFVDNKWTVFNCDISTCDASHTKSMFDLMLDIFDAPEELRMLLWKQIMADIRVNIKKCDPVFLRPTDFYLQSGSIITTLINSVAQIVIWHRFSIRPFLRSDDIIEAAKNVGYVITLEKCNIFEDLQFLKMSPTLDVYGVYHATINLGVIFRASGTCRGDVPKALRKRDLHNDARSFQHKLMCGMLNRIQHPILDKLAIFPLERSKRTLDFAKKQVNAILFMEHGPCHSYNDSIFTRYQLSSNEIKEIYNLILTSDIGTVIYSTGIHKIFQKDYGLSCPLY